MAKLCACDRDFNMGLEEGDSDGRRKISFLTEEEKDRPELLLALKCSGHNRWKWSLMLGQELPKVSNALGNINWRWWN